MKDKRFVVLKDFKDAKRGDLCIQTGKGRGFTQFNDTYMMATKPHHLSDGTTNYYPDDRDDSYWVIDIPDELVAQVVAELTDSHEAYALSQVEIATRRVIEPLLSLNTNIQGNPLKA